MSSQAFDIAIIGSGPGGYRAAVLAALRGLKAAIIEQGTWGGNCLNRGCVLKKAWYHTARLLANPKRLACRGVRGTLAPDFPQAWRDQRRIVERVRASYVDFLERLGVRAFSGAARFSAPGELTVDGAERVCANSIVVATGSVPIVPATLGLHPDRVLTTDALFDDPPPPGKRIAVVGSGVIGTEMSFILAMLGLKVVWLTQAEPLTRSRYSAPALKLVRAALADLGIAPRTGNRPLGSRVERGSLRSKRALRRSRSATHVGSYVSSPMRTRERCSARRRSGFMRASGSISRAHGPGARMHSRISRRCATTTRRSLKRSSTRPRRSPRDGDLVIGFSAVRGNRLALLGVCAGGDRCRSPDG